MITDFPVDKLDKFTDDLEKLLIQYKYKLTTLTTNSGKKLAIVDDSLHPAKIVGFIAPDNGNLIIKVPLR